MNRVIKFRAWDPESRTMFEPFDFHLAQETDNGFHAFRFHDNGDFAFLEPMQFTGLRDKNGAEIYEGDILEVMHRPMRVKDDVFTRSRFFVTNLLCVYGDSYHLEHVSGYFCPTHIIGNDAMGTLANVSIVGNIHVNPELLKEAGNE